MAEPARVIDFRVRPPYGSFLGLSILDPTRSSPTMHGVEMAPSLREQSFDLFLDEMDEAGIDLGVVMGRQCGPDLGFIANDEVARMVREHPESLVGFGAIDPQSMSDPIGEVSRCINDLGLHGIVVDPGGLSDPIYADDASLRKVFARCAELRVPVAVGQSALLGPDISYCHPVAVQRVARAFPSLPIIVSHACWPWVLPMLGVAFSTPNIYLLPDFYLHIPGMPGAGEIVAASNYYLSDRLLYGSAYPVRPLKASLEEFRDLDLDPAVQEAALTRTPRHLLGLGD
ncbi:MAG: amidohydrolase family protein [Dehalococcoidia bacterium]